MNPTTTLAARQPLSHLSNRLPNPLLTLSLLGLLVCGCSGADPMTGSWVQPDGTTPLPSAVGGGDLDIDATLDLDGAASPATFSLLMTLEASGLADTIEAEGTYVDDGTSLTLTFTGFVIDPATGNTSTVADDGSQCVNLQGFANTPVCFRVPQTNNYTLAGDGLSIVLNHTIAGAPESETTLTLTRANP